MAKNRSTCACGWQVNVVRYVNGKKTCDHCVPVNLSGTFLRRLEGEARYYAKDILQPGTSEFEEVYGKRNKNKT